MDDGGSFLRWLNVEDVRMKGSFIFLKCYFIQANYEKSVQEEYSWRHEYIQFLQGWHYGAFLSAWSKLNKGALTFLRKEKESDPEKKKEGEEEGRRGKGKPS